MEKAKNSQAQTLPSENILPEDLQEIMLLLASENSEILYEETDGIAVAQHAESQSEQGAAAAVAALDSIQAEGLNDTDLGDVALSEHHVASDAPVDAEQAQEEASSDYNPTPLVQEYFGEILGYNDLLVFADTADFLKQETVNARYFSQVIHYDAFSQGAEQADLAIKAASFDHLSRPVVNIAATSLKSASLSAATVKPGLVAVDEDSDIVNNNPKPDPQPDPKPDPQPDPKPDPKPDPQPDPKPDPKPDPEPDPQPDPQPYPKPGIIGDISEEDLKATTIDDFIAKKDLGDLYNILGENNPVAGKATLEQYVAKGASLLDLLNTYPGIAKLDLSLSDGDKNLISDLDEQELKSIALEDVLSDGVKDALFYSILGDGSEKKGMKIANEYVSNGYTLYDVVDAHSDLAYFHTDLL